MDPSRLIEFRGRIRRTEWWLTQLALWGVFAVSVVAIALSHGHDGDGTADDIMALGIVSLAALVVLLQLAAGVKRLHDLGQTGWLILMLFVPAVGWLIAIIVLGCLPGTPGDNRFGAPPEERDRNPLADLFDD